MFLVSFLFLARINPFVGVTDTHWRYQRDQNLFKRDSERQGIMKCRKKFKELQIQKMVMHTKFTLVLKIEAFWKRRWRGDGVVLCVTV